MTSTTRYEIRGALKSCDWDLEPSIASCYKDTIALKATTDAEAFAEAEDLQYAHENDAWIVIENAEDRGEDTTALRISLEFAPYYAAHIVKIVETKLEFF